MSKTIENLYEYLMFELNYEKIDNLEYFIQNINIKFLKIKDFKKDLLFGIVKNNNTEIFDYCLKNYHFNINELYEDNKTILEYVSENKKFNYYIAKSLLNYQSPNINIVDYWGNNPIWTSVYNKHLKRNSDFVNDYNNWIKDLYNKGFRPNKRSIDAIYHYNDIDLKEILDI